MRSEPERMKSVNILVTKDVLDMISAQGNRSLAVRQVMAAILASARDGLDMPLEKAREAAVTTSSKVRKTMTPGGPDWRKSIIWIPERMHDEIARNCFGSGLRPADLIRGSLIALHEEQTSRILRAETGTSGEAPANHV